MKDKKTKALCYECKRELYDIRNYAIIITNNTALLDIKDKFSAPLYIKICHECAKKITVDKLIEKVIRDW